MRNRYIGVCYRCQKTVDVGEGHFERFGNRWRTQHATCAIEHRGEPDPARQALNQTLDAIKAQGTGKRANRARKRIRDRANKMLAGLSDDLV